MSEYEDKKKAHQTKSDTLKNSESVKNIQIAPVLKIHEIFTYNGGDKEKKDN